jgi:uncharacterized protein YoxC
MGRKVSVSLEADIAGFVRPVEMAKKSVDDLGDKVDRLDDELDKIPDDAAKAAAALKLLSGSVDDVGHKVTTLADKGVHLAALDAKIRETRTEVRKLGDEFVRTGDVDVFKKLSDATGRLKGLQDTRSKIKDALLPDDLPREAEKLAEGFFKRFASRAEEWGNKIGQLLPAGIAGALSNPIVGPILGVALIVALMAAVDYALTVGGGVILGAAGLGAVGLGIMGALLGDPEVTGAAWKKTLSEVKDQFLAASTHFREPLIDAAHEFGDALASIDMDKIFAQAAQFLPPLVKGAADFARYMGQAAEYLIAGAGPEIKVLAAELPKVGNAVALASKEIAGNSGGGAMALKDTLGVVELLIAGIGGLIGFSERWYATLVKINDALSPIPHTFFLPPDLPPRLDNAARSIHGISVAANTSTQSLEEMLQQVNATTVSVDSLAAAMVNKLFTATMNLDQATLGVAESLTRVKKTLEENSKAFDKHTSQIAINTEKGQANREAVLGAVTANMQLYQAQVAAGMSSEDAAKQYDQNTAALEAQLKKAHLTQGEIDGLIGKYRGIPAKVDTDIAINGLTAAINGLADLIKMINGIHDKTVTVYYRTRGQSLNAPLAHGGIRRAAVGMVIPPSDPGTTLVGEPQTGGEVLIPLRGVSQGRAADLLNTAGAGYGLTVSAARGGYAEMRSAGQMGWSGGGGPTQLELTLRVDPARDTGIGSLVQKAFANQEVQVFAGGQPVQVRR